MDATDIKSALGTAVATMLKALGFPIHRIGALFDVNQGRVSELTGTRRPDYSLLLGEQQ